MENKDQEVHLVSKDQKVDNNQQELLLSMSEFREHILRVLELQENDTKGTLELLRKTITHPNRSKVSSDNFLARLAKRIRNLRSQDRQDDLDHNHGKDNLDHNHVKNDLDLFIDFIQELDLSFIDNNLDQGDDPPQNLPKPQKSVVTKLTLTLIPSSLDQQLTPHYLATTVAPYLAALEELQHLSDEIQGNEPSKVKIKSITQNSPLQVTLEGAAKAVEITQEIITPWRREHAIEMAYLKEEQTRVEIEQKRAEVLIMRAKAARERAEAQELAEAQKAEAEAMQAEVEAKKAEALERRARAARDRAKAKQMEAEATKVQLEAERMRLENEKLRLELYQAKVQLGLDIINKLNPALAEAERFAYLTRLLPVVDTLLLSDLTMSGSV